MAPPSNISTINESQQAPTGNTPRTSRSHLLAGLRTAPKSPMPPGSAPLNPAQHSYNRGGSPPTNQRLRNMGVPQTAIGNGFGNVQRRGVNRGANMYGLPEILAPPELQYEQEQDTAGMDAEEYAALMVQGQQLAAQQALLQQQLHSLSMAQHQMQNLNLGGGMGQQQMQSTMNGFYSQQVQSGMQPVVTPVPGTPGLYSVFNPMTGQQKLMVNEQEQAQAQVQAQVQVTHNDLSHSPPPTTPTFHAQVSPPPESNAPLSSVTGFAANATDGPRGPVPRTASFPLTPQTGTFGPGQSRAGDHPIRQPRGPPSLEDLVEKPTSKHEGSKNFATRQRRRALNSLVRAGVSRRGASRGSNSLEGSPSGTPSSECEITFSVTSESDDDSVGSSNSGSVHGAIGSERKKFQEHSRERNSTGNSLTAQSLSSEEGIGGKMVEITVEDQENKNEQRGQPMLVLTSATEKRRSAVF
ncbi:uncharacterized protein KY384_008102 [Bacidia gigantensis]|uniref:uncharacterized protein n=1 Tax=Bacidia gigantensis TaxID=2732470 RepID=UPI001D04C62A|nr:uncharacterized protein KY384_008102 [Bacidia gigantensis]KAG8526673.1 hypothetical protein KY384_008102 [Bacidia gigantensis]